MLPPAGDLALDACVAINLCATRRVREILQRLPYDFRIVDRAAGECRYILTPNPSTGAREREPIDLQPLVADGLLRLEALQDGPETELFIETAARLDDGEAATLALAVTRGWPIATDERRARRILTQEFAHVPLFSTCQLLRRFCDEIGSGPNEIAELLRNVREGARFVPPRYDPERTWWDRFWRDTGGP